LHDNSSLFPIIFSINNIGFDINRDAKNVKSPGTMWGMHYNIDTIINSHIENNQYIPLVFTLLNDKNQESYINIFQINYR